MKIYSICVSVGFITFGFIINVYLVFKFYWDFIEFSTNIANKCYKEDNEPINAIYTKMDFLTYNEKLFYRKLLPLHKENTKYRTELFRNIDFGIFNKDFELLLLIELNDKSHIQRNRKIRDRKVKNILKECNIPL